MSGRRGGAGPERGPEGERLVACAHGSWIANRPRSGPTVTTEPQGLAAAQDEIARRTRQQAALAELGQAALTRADVGLLVGQTCAVVEWALAASYVSIVQANGNELALRFGVGTNQTFSACNDAAMEHRPLLLCTLTLRDPVVFRTVVADARVN